MKIKNNKSGKLITINVLEYAVVIISFAASTVAVNERLQKPSDSTLALQHSYPIVLNKVDNTSAESWTTKACKSSLTGKALAEVFCSLMINNPLGVSSDRIGTKDNVIADDITRKYRDANNIFNPSLLMQDHPELQSCCHFHPSKELLLRVNDALLCKKLPSPLLPITMLGHFKPTNSISLNTVGLNT